jgi:hypothetical protein
VKSINRMQGQMFLISDLMEGIREFL